MTLRLDYLPIQTNYSSDVLEGVNRETLLDGGLSRKRSDIVIPWHVVQCTWLVPRAEYDVFMGFFRTTLKNASQPFLLDLITDIGIPTTHVCRTIGGEPKLVRQSGEGYWVQATLQAKANPTVTSYASVIEVFKNWYFDGVNDNALVGDFHHFERTQAFTLSAWVRTTSSVNGPLIGNARNDSTARGYVFYNRTTAPAGLMLEINSTTASNSIKAYIPSTTINLLDGVEHHVVATYSGSSNATGVKLYVDGVEYGATITQNNLSSTAVPAAGTTNLRIGARDSGNFHKDYIRHISIWNDELDVSQVVELYNSRVPGNLLTHSASANLQSWWKFDNDDTLGPGGISDYGPANRDATAQSGLGSNQDNEVVTHHTTRQTIREEWDFDGIDDAVFLPDDSSLNFERNQSFSISAWVRPDSTPNSGCGIIRRVRQDTSQQKGYSFMLEDVAPNDRSLFFNIGDRDVAGNTNKIVANSVGKLTFGTLYHVVVTYNGSSNVSGVLFYINAVSTAKQNTTNAMSQNIAGAAIPVIGNLSLQNRAWHGLINNVSVWNIALSQAQITSIYNLGNGGNLLSLGLSSNLKGWWKLTGGDTTAESGILDHSGNSLHGTAKGGYGTKEIPVKDIITYKPATTDWQFDGVDDTITIGDVHDKAAGTAFSVSGWFATKQGGGAFTSEARLFAKRGASGNFSGWGVLFTSASAKLVWAYGGPDSGGARRSEIFTNAGWADGNLHNFVCTKSTNNTVTGLKIYVDGVLQSTGINFNTFSGSPVNAVSLAIDQGGLFKGLLQHMAIWNKELSASEALQIYNNGIPGDLMSTSMAANLEGWWKVDGSDISGINGVEDHSSNNNHGTASGGLGNNNSWVFDGVDDYAEGTDVLDKQRTDPFSASFWFKTTKLTQMAAIRKGSTGDHTVAGDAGWQFFVRANSTVPIHGAIQFTMRAAAANNALSVRAGSNLDDGVFHHALVVYTGTSTPAGVTIYIDGVATAGTTENNTLSASTLNTVPFRIGFSDTQPYDGTLQHVSVWSKALSPTEVAEVYNSGTPGNLSNTSMSANLEAWYKLDGTDTTDTNGVIDHSGSGFHMTALNGLGKDRGYHIEYPDVAISYGPGDYIRIIDSRGTHPENYTDLDLDGTYQVESTSGKDKIRLVNPEQINTDWYKLYALDDEYGPVNKGDVLSTVTKVPT